MRNARGASAPPEDVSAWQRTSKSTMRNGDWLIVKFPWNVYVLWNKEEFVGRFDSFEEAKGLAVGTGSRSTSETNKAVLER